MSSWICEGIARDGKQHPNQNPPTKHDPYENFGSDCVICCLRKEQVIGSSKPSIKPTHTVAIVGVLTTVLLAGIGGVHWWSSRSCSLITEKRVQGTCYKDLQKASLVVGILTEPESYQSLSNYLKEKLGDDVQPIKIEQSQTYQETRNHIARKEWDLVFAYSPMNSMAANDNGYTWVARMFPQFAPYYKAAIFVRDNSSIKSLNDIKPSHTIALGNFSSASGFYVPIYYLYGSTIKVTMNHKNRDIISMVKEGKVDLGVATYTSIKDDSHLKAIMVSQDIPGSGVYLSPKLSKEDRERIKNVLLEAPPEIQKQANYSKDNEPAWNEIRKIAVKAEAVISCANFNVNPVRIFGCQSSSASATNVPDGTKLKVNSFKLQGDEYVWLTASSANGDIYHLVVDLKTLSGVPNGNTPRTIMGKNIVVSSEVKPKELSQGGKQLLIVNSNQISVL